MPNAGSRSTRLLSPSSPASQNARNDSRHQSIHLSSPVSAQRSVRARLPEIPCDPGMVSKGRAAALPLVVSRGSSGGKFEIPPDNLSWEARGDILLIRKEYPLASRRPSSAALHAPFGAWPTRLVPRHSPGCHPASPRGGREPAYILIYARQPSSSAGSSPWAR